MELEDINIEANRTFLYFHSPGGARDLRFLLPFLYSETFSVGLIFVIHITNFNAALQYSLDSTEASGL